MQGLTGTWRLVRLALRRDRIKLPLILLALAAVFIFSAKAAIDFYGTSEKEQITYALTNATSVVARVFNGPINGPDIGAIVMNETYIFTALTLAFITAMTIVRHTRQNEEFGRSELIESGIVSRHASLAAAMIVAALSSVIFAVLAYISLISLGLPAGGSLGASAALGATGLTFAAIAAVCAQLADSGRGANSMASLAIGAAFLLRAIGDGLGTVTQNGMVVESAFPSWLSPLGWGQQIFPYTEQNWWIFGLYVALFGGMLGLAVIFMNQRDIGMGMIPTRLGLARAKQVLLSPLGLARRLQRGTLFGWAAVIVILGASYGLVIKEFGDFMRDNEQIQEAFGQFASGVDVNDIFLSVLISFMAITVSAYGIQSLLRLRSEESGGQVESILTTGVSRTGWQCSHIGYAAFGTVLLTLLSGLSMGGTYILSSHLAWGELWPIVGASLVNMAPTFTLLGLVVLLIAVMPRLALMAAWGTFAGCLMILQLGALLKLPQWVMNLSPFGHLPAMPAESFEPAPVIWLSVAALLFFIGGLLYFRRRDIVTA